MESFGEKSNKEKAKPGMHDNGLEFMNSERKCCRDNEPNTARQGSMPALTCMIDKELSKRSHEIGVLLDKTSQPNTVRCMLSHAI